jgi:hypothetical protein
LVPSPEEEKKKKKKAMESLNFLPGLALNCHLPDLHLLELKHCFYKTGCTSQGAAQW